MSDYTPTTEEVREFYWIASGDPRRGSGAWAEFDRWLALHDTDLLASIVPEEVRTHWEWTEQQRTSFKDSGCACGACQIMANIAKITGRSEGGA